MLRIKGKEAGAMITADGGWHNPTPDKVRP